MERQDGAELSDGSPRAGQDRQSDGRSCGRNTWRQQGVVGQCEAGERGEQAAAPSGREKSGLAAAPGGAWFPLCTGFKATSQHTKTSTTTEMSRYRFI